MANPFDQFDAASASANPFDQFDAPEASAGTISPEIEAQLRHDMPLQQFQPQHTGYRATVNAAFANNIPVHGPVPTPEELGRQYGDLGRGVAVGVPAGIPGLAGDIESLGRRGLSAVGAPVATATTLPTSEDIGNTLAGPARSQEEAVGRSVGNMIGPGVAVNAAKYGTRLMAPLIAGAGPTEAAQAAHDAGYALPPNMASARPGVISQALSAISGKIKLQQAASAKNQGVTNGLAAQALGLADDTKMTPDAIAAVRESAGQAYKDVAAAVPTITPDSTFQSTIGGLGKRTSEAAKAFPGLVKNGEIEDLVSTLNDAKSFSPQAGLELVRHLRSDASANLRAFDSPAKQALGLAQRQAAEAVDDLMERNIEAAGKPDIVQAYRDARQQIARSYDVQAALDPATGNVNARILGALAKKGRPLTGQLKDIADAARAFPKATQSMAQVGGEERLGVLDVGAAGLSHGATIPLSLARPGSRAAILSAPYQNMLMRMGPNAPAANGLDQLSAALALPSALRPEERFNRSINGP